MRRFRNGVSANASYTYSKAIDNAVQAQNYLDTSAERALSASSRTHVFNLSWQYSTAVGRGGGTLVNGWKGAVLKDWTLTNNISVASGTPLTPTVGGARSTTTGTGITGSLRANATGLAGDRRAAGQPFNYAAFAAPAAGQWGNAGRNTITGPTQFSLNASLGRNFRVAERKSLDLRFDAQNALNHVTFRSFNTTIGSNNLGLLSNPAAMRSTDRDAAVHDSRVRLRELTNMRRHHRHTLERTAGQILAHSLTAAAAADAPTAAAAAPKGVVKFGTTTQLVVVDVTVKDKSGNPIKGLKPSRLQHHRRRQAAGDQGLQSSRNWKRPPRRLRPVPAIKPAPAPKAIEAPDRAGAPAVKSVTANQIAPSKPGEVKYKDRRLLVMFFDMTAHADSGSDPRADGRAEVPQDPDDALRPDGRHDLLHRPEGAAGFHRRSRRARQGRSRA